MVQKNAAWHKFLNEKPELNVPFPGLPQVPNLLPAELAKVEDFWEKVYELFPRDKEVVNLNSGAVSCNSLMVENAFLSYYKMLNQAPSYYWLKVMDLGRKAIKTGLAELLNAQTDEVAILRNATEALNNLIFGLKLKKDDEIVACHQDYIKCVASWKQRELRDNIRVKWVSLDGPNESDDDIVHKYISAITDKTKLIHLTHVINWNGQVLPVKKIIHEAKKRNVEVLLDGSHSFGLLETDVKELGCDYFATALHKWLGGPIPSGMLFCSKEKIKHLWPLASSMNPFSDDCEKFEELSIQLLPNILGLGYAMDFYHWIGRQNKEKRLRYLRRHFTNQIAENPMTDILTPLDESRCCTILNIRLRGWQPSALESSLLNKYKIHVSPVTYGNMDGIRVTPNIYTRPDSMDYLARALNELATGSM